MSVTLLSGLLAGYALVVACTIYAVVDLDYPRSGWIRLDVADNALAQLRDSIR